MILRNAQLAAEQWKEFENQHRKDADKFRRFFHLRPCASYVTIVTTHQSNAMRGVACAPTKLSLAMNAIADAIDGDTVDWKKIAKHTESGSFNFSKRTANSITKKREPEFAAQAQIINEIISGKHPFSFIGSEVILHKGNKGKRERIDIVAQDKDGKIIFIEVKAEGSSDDAREQVRRYLQKYSSCAQFALLLTEYPMYRAAEITGYIGMTATGTNISSLSTKLTFHGANKIGGCITEIESESGTRIIIDVGSNLPGNAKARNVNIKNISKSCDGVFITHYHGDHIGEFTKINDGVPIHMGKDARKIFLTLQRTLKAANIKDANPDFVERRITPFEEDCDPIPVCNDMTVKPLHADHSAFDSYMYLIECDNKKILHTGDFRTHGWSGDNLWAEIEKIGEIDVLITEGTMLSRGNPPIKTEADLLEDAINLMQNHNDKNFFILISSTNIDSLRTFYLASEKTDKLFVCDRYQKSILDVVSASKRGKEYKMSNALEYGIAAYHRMKKQSFCMPIRANRYSNKFEKIMKRFQNNVLIYSIWEGYLKKGYPAFDQAIYDFVEKASELGNEIVKGMHTSGHAYEETLIRLCEVIKPKIIIPIHSEYPKKLKKLGISGRIEEPEGSKFEMIL